MRINGKAIAEEIITRVRTRVDALSHAPSFLAIAVAPTPATESYLRMKQRQAEKAGVRMELRLYESQTNEGLMEVLSHVDEDAVIVQLPLPATIDTERVLNAIPPEKDADVLSAETRDAGLLTHPVAAAIREVLREGKVDLDGKKVTVVGQGWLVGKPAAEWLRAQGAEVTVVTKDAGDLTGACKTADIIVSGAGAAGLITPDLVHEGVVVIDIGTSELGGSIAGDVAPEVEELSSLFTPVPGGVGPITVACLLENVIALAEQPFAN